MSTEEELSEFVNELFDMARRGTLTRYHHQVCRERAGFDLWEVADGDGWTLAHEAADAGTLPADFDRWELSARDGTTVAHVAVVHRWLPANFAGWERRNRAGWTVAGLAARNHHLPPSVGRRRAPGPDYDTGFDTGWMPGGSVDNGRGLAVRDLIDPDLEP